jgi:hypothetical protein
VCDTVSASKPLDELFINSEPVSAEHMNNKGFGWKRLCPYQGKILAFTWWDCGIPRKPLRIVIDPAEIRTLDLLNMRLEHYLYANPPDGYILIC